MQVEFVHRLATTLAAKLAYCISSSIKASKIFINSKCFTLTQNSKQELSSQYLAEIKLQISHCSSLKLGVNVEFRGYLTGIKVLTHSNQRPKKAVVAKTRLS